MMTASQDNNTEFIRHDVYHAPTTKMAKSNSIISPMPSTTIDIHKETNNSLSLATPCPLCDEIPSQNAGAATNKYPILCSTEECGYNICSPCLLQLLSTSQEESPLQASDGNDYNLKLRCPNCRGHFCVLLQDVLLLRRGELWRLELQNVNDMELSASDLREKHFWDEERIEELKMAETRYHDHSKTLTDAYTNTESLSEKISVGLTTSNRLIVSRESFEQRTIKELDNMMLAGLENAMSEAERKYIISLMISGRPEKLAQAAELIASLKELRTTKLLNSLELTQTFDPTPSIPMNRGISMPHPSIVKSPSELRQPTQFTRAKSMTCSPNRNVPFRPKPITHQGRSIGYARGGISRSSVTARNPSRRASIAGENRQWRRLHPLPIRMPHSYSICLDFDPYSRWGCNLSFLDDIESFAGLHRPPGNRNIRENLVKDTFERLSVDWWNEISKEPVAVGHVHGVNNLLGSQIAIQTTSDTEIPYRRVIVSSVKGPLRKLGIQVGDVVTHVNGEAFDGSAEKLRWIIHEMRSEVNLEHGRNGFIYPNLRIVVNAEVGTAEVLRLRSLVAKAGLKQRQS